jgi:ATP-binding cassette subfamily B protein
MEQGARFESSLIETIRSYATLKHSGAEHYFAGKSTAALGSLGSTLVKSGKAAAFTGGLADFISKIFTVFVLWAGGREMITGTLTPGDLISFFTIISLFTSPLAEIVTSSSSLREGTVAAGRVFEIMDLEAEPLDTGVTAGTEAPESIIFENVSFSYPGRATVLANLNLSFRRGEITAITGESGSGKSTIVTLITRMRNPGGGIISAGGVNISHINLRSWRGNLAVVPQSPGLFDGTITENIAPGEEEPDLGRIVEICSDLGILGFLQSMPMGFESRAGEGGSSLSRGQQQRIAVARALYRDAPILVLDEATSSLDGESEALIERAVIREKSRGKIVILISHKDRSRTIADRIYSI